MNNRSQKAFTLVELLVVISIIALLLAVLMPSLGKARNQARLILCGTRQKTILNGLSIYSAEWGGKQPPSIQGRAVDESLPNNAVFWTRPMRLRYYYNPERWGGGLNGGCVFAILGDYLRDTSYFCCPLSPNYGDAKWQEDYITKEGQAIDFLNCGYNLLWSYEGYDIEGFNPLKKNKGTLMVSDILLWGSADTAAVNGNTKQWTSAHPFKGSSPKPFRDGTSQVLDDNRDLYHMISDPRKLTLPDVKLNAGYIDGHVERFRSTNQGIEVQGKSAKLGNKEQHSILPKDW